MAEKASMRVAFTRAFEAWETDFRAHPENYLTDAEIAALNVLPLSEQRAVCFEALLNSLAGGLPWMNIP